MNVKLSVVIPAYNEGKTIVNVLEGLKRILQTVSQPYEIIVINDGSADDTGQRAHDCGAEVIEHRKNLGYGRSLKDGIRVSRGEFILLIDADGTYDISQVPSMLRSIEDADLVIGKRIFLQKSKDHFKNITRRFFTYLASYYSGKKVEDLNSGQRIFRRRDIIDKLDAFPDGFSFSSTITTQYLLTDKKIVYVPIAYNDRRKGSKFISGSHICAIAKLALTLTLKTRPFKLLTQLSSILIIAILLIIIEHIFHAGLFVELLSFAIVCPFLFLLFLCYIYAMGRDVIRYI